MTDSVPQTADAGANLGGWPPRASLLSEVRAATREAHERLEQQLDLEHQASLERYWVFVRATCAVVRPLEPSLTAFLGPIFAAPEPGTRVSRLLADLAHLGPEDPPDDAPGMEAVDSLAAAFGAAYVLQGSLLGGAVIARAVRDRLGLADQGTQYLRLYAGGLAHAWRQFVNALDAFGAHGSDDERRVTKAMAGQTFRAFAAALEREGLTTG